MTHTCTCTAQFVGLILLFFQDNKRESVERIAYEIAKQAHDLSFDPNYMSPFAKNAVENGFNVKGAFI